MICVRVCTLQWSSFSRNKRINRTSALSSLSSFISTVTAVNSSSKKSTTATFNASKIAGVVIVGQALNLFFRHVRLEEVFHWRAGRISAATKAAVRHGKVASLQPSSSSSSGTNMSFSSRNAAPSLLMVAPM